MAANFDNAESGNRKLWIDVAILLVLCWALFFSLLGDRPLWDIDEGMHAHTSKVMVQTGDWVTPTMNGENFYDKPPLFNWLVAMAFMVFGFTEFAARLPAALLGTACVIATYVLGRKLFDRMTGLLGGVILATSLEFLVMSRVVVHDIALALTVTLSLLFFWFAFEDEDRRNQYLFWFYVSCGFAVLAKGPLGLVLVGLVVGPWLLLRRRLSFVREMGLWWGAIVFLAVAAPWYVLIMRANADFGAYFFIQQNFMNFVSAESRHPEPWYYYFAIVVGGFFPWTAFLPMAVGHGLRIRHEDDRGRLLYLGLWCGMMLLFFSSASSKLPSYILPMFPALALLVAVAWRDLLVRPTQRLRNLALGSLAVLAGILVVAFVYYGTRELESAMAKYNVDAAVFMTTIAVLVMGVVLATALCWRRFYRSCFATIAGAVVLFILAVNSMVVPPLNEYRSTKELGRRIDLVIPAGEPIVFYRDLRDSTLFYTDRLGHILRDTGQFVEHMAQDRPAHCVVKRQHLENFDHGLLEDLFVVDGDDGKVVLSNRPPEEWGGTSNVQR